ncbi:hypothetical protein TREMEDRAFT_56277 [Tremella mesenterica DSM 1558]|uniref:uncharacterized protein n=1 Tax=Tremella mesenterica (strain ATCC 24925 / CBS 8224 / DSM 1558 / NBRC 9311 / NRRL Y-6157 / RJB 2259-6 / UBC 559-6) TaxID=578456 RepID=UPI0003F4A33D|nr:uncharacterized protein TREMEDRAFT_56277 [Tremella mesenterica DSM 1558]EIW73694.1 hypothetical protein TREMEDRAFT_56277 [Tremella mesenterica DSM 1558]
MTKRRKVCLNSGKRKESYVKMVKNSGGGRAGEDFVNGFEGLKMWRFRKTCVF